MKSENYSLMNLEKLNIQEEMNYSCDTMLHIYPTANMDYSVLTDREKSILDKVITKFSAYRAKDIVEYMHKEKAYTETRPGDEKSARSDFSMYISYSLRRRNAGS